MTATIYAESEFILDVVCLNLSDGTAKSSRYSKIPALREALAEKGIRIKSIDHGICQWNDYWHSDEISPDEAINDPEKAVRLMARYWRLGEKYRLWWIAYKSKRHVQFLAMVQKPMK